MSGKTITMDGVTAHYTSHELKMMRRLTNRAENTEGKTRTALIAEIRLIHQFKAKFPGSEFDKDEIEQAETEYSKPVLLPAPAKTDHGLYARSTDPENSHLAATEIEEQEGTTATLTYGSQKHRILETYARMPRPITDTEAWNGAGIGPRSGAWHRCSDLLHAGAIKHVNDVIDLETNKLVRVCSITDMGKQALQRLLQGERQIKISI